MSKYISTRGGIAPVDFETAVLKGFADDGGMFVPQSIPKISQDRLRAWSGHSFNQLAFEILSLYIGEETLPAADLKALIEKSTAPFTHPEVVPVSPLGKETNQFILELFHGPTLSFKDVAMGFLINTMDYFLARKKDRAALLIATTGDTGPAAAWASQGKETIDCWVLYPREFISQEQERQMSTLNAPNVRAVSVENCPNGGDDLDVVIARMFEDRDQVERLRLSSVNSINWCRVLFQSIHYFYAYYRVAETVGEKIAFSVPTGAFGNMFAGYLAREMGLPVERFICANNANATIHRVHDTQAFTRLPLIQTPANAIDIALPYNFWRFLYFTSGQNSELLSQWMDSYAQDGTVPFDPEMMDKITHGFITAAVSNQETLTTIKEIHHKADYLLDPHGAVAVAAALRLAPELPADTKIISLLTAHPAKFPEVTRKALNGDLPPAGTHPDLEAVKTQFHRVLLCHHNILEPALVQAMTQANPN